METRPPKVSIIMPCYGMGKYIGEALESIAQQSFQDWELIAVDDQGPEDGSLAILEAFTQNEGKHKTQIIRHENNRGVSAARNTAVRASSGQWLAFLDPDDFWDPTYLQHLHAAADNAPRNDNFIFFGQRHIVNQQGVPVMSPQPERGASEKVDDDYHAVLKTRLNRINFIPPSQVILPRKCAELFDELFDQAPGLQHIEDWDLWHRLLSSGFELFYVPKATMRYRTHPEGATKKLPMYEQRIALSKQHSRNQELVENLRQQIIDLKASNRNRKKQSSAWRCLLSRFTMWAAVRSRLKNFFIE